MAHGDWVTFRAPRGKGGPLAADLLAGRSFDSMTGVTKYCVVKRHAAYFKEKLLTRD